jgi:hypothetical protein
MIGQVQEIAARVRELRESKVSPRRLWRGNWAWTEGLRCWESGASDIPVGVLSRSPDVSRWIWPNSSRARLLASDLLPHPRIVVRSRSADSHKYRSLAHNFIPKKS